MIANEMISLVANTYIPSILSECFVAGIYGVWVYRFALQKPDIISFLTLRC